MWWRGWLFFTHMFCAWGYPCQTDFPGLHLYLYTLVFSWVWKQVSSYPGIHTPSFLSLAVLECESPSVRVSTFLIWKVPYIESSLYENFLIWKVRYVESSHEKFLIWKVPYIESSLYEKMEGSLHRKFVIWKVPYMEGSLHRTWKVPHIESFFSICK